MSARVLRTQHVPALTLESGAVLRDVRQAYHLDGALNDARDNLVLVFHALTGSADAAAGWWSGVIGPGRAIDTRRFAVLCPNLLGSCYGTTGAWEADRRPFPAVTPRDMAALVRALVAELGVTSVALAVGGSLGGMAALEWAAGYPGLTRGTVVLAAPAAHTASAIAWNHLQRRILDAAGPEEGIAIARGLAMMTYRTAAELDSRFGRETHPEGGFAVERYLAAHGAKLRDRFEVESYRTLLGAMDAHDVGRGRGGVAAALRGVTGRLTAVGIPGDLLYDAEVVRDWARLAGAAYREIRSRYGHDAFLLEAEQVGGIVREALEWSEAPVPAGAS